MKRPKRKQSSSSTKKSLRARTRQPVKPHFPSREAWNDIVRDYGLTSAQAKALDFTLREAFDEIDLYNANLRNQPTRALLIDRLKTFEKALHGLLEECRRNADLMHSFLPHNTLAYIGRSLTFSAIGEALGRSIFPKNFDFKIRVKRAQGEQITFALMDDLSRSRRETLGLEYGHVILTHFIEMLHAPFARWCHMTITWFVLIMAVIGFLSLLLAVHLGAYWVPPP